MSDEREYSVKRFAIAGVACPACHAFLERDAKWCLNCNFTGQKSLEMFGDEPPPLLPILDVANLWDVKGHAKILEAVSKFQKKFPQVNWRVCAVNLAPEMNLALFGFWLLNACPLLSDETDESREWTVLLLVDGASTRVSISCGYRAEVWVSTEMWNQIIPDATALISKQKPLKAVLHLIQRSEKLFETAWQHAKQQLQSNSTR